VGRRQRRRQNLGESGRDPGPELADSKYPDTDGNVLVLRGRLTPRTRLRYAETLHGGLDREDARQRATELLFEHLAVSWTIAGLQVTAQKEILGRYRMASAEERQFVREALREHVGEFFPELEAP
jgi:hypothetical protein